MSTVSFLLDKALSSLFFSHWLLAAFTFQIRCQSRRLKTAVNFSNSVISRSLNLKYSVLPGDCQNWRGTHFSRNQGHMADISSQLLSVQGLVPKTGKIRSWQDQQTYILYLYTYIDAIESPVVWYRCCWGWVGFAGAGGICSAVCTFPTTGATAPSSHPPALLAGKSDLSSYPSGKKSFSLATLRNTRSPFSVLLSSSSYFLRATLSLGSQLELASFAHFVNLTVFTWVPARFSGQLSRNVAVTEDQKWSNCVIA